MERLLLALVACACACAGPLREKDRAPMLGTMTPSDATDQIRARIAAQYAAVERGDLDGFGALLAEDVFLFGSDPNEVLVGREAVIANLRKSAAERMRHDVHRTFASTALRIGVASGGRSAWVSDEIEYTLLPPAPAPRRVIHFRMTAFWTRVANAWTIAATHWSIAAPKGAHTPIPRPVPAKVGSGAEPLAEQAARLFASVGKLAAELSDRGDALFVGTEPGEHAGGAESVRRHLGQLASRGDWRLAPPGSIRAMLAPDGQAGWVATDLVLPTGIAGQEATARALLIYVLEQGAWKLVQLHLSRPLPD